MSKGPAALSDGLAGQAPGHCGTAAKNRVFVANVLSNQEDAVSVTRDKGKNEKILLSGTSGRSVMMIVMEFPPGHSPTCIFLVAKAGECNIRGES
jgi:hypothetical protein